MSVSAAAAQSTLLFSLARPSRPEPSTGQRLTLEEQKEKRADIRREAKAVMLDYAREEDELDRNGGSDKQNKVVKKLAEEFGISSSEAKWAIKDAKEEFLEERGADIRRQAKAVIIDYARERADLVCNGRSNERSKVAKKLAEEFGISCSEAERAIGGAEGEILKERGADIRRRAEAVMFDYARKEYELSRNGGNRNGGSDEQNKVVKNLAEEFGISYREARWALRHAEDDVIIPLVKKIVKELEGGKISKESMALWARLHMALYGGGSVGPLAPRRPKVQGSGAAGAEAAMSAAIAAMNANMAAMNANMAETGARAAADQARARAIAAAPPPRPRIYAEMDEASRAREQEHVRGVVQKLKAGVERFNKSVLAWTPQKAQEAREKAWQDGFDSFRRLNPEAPEKEAIASADRSLKRYLWVGERREESTLQEALSSLVSSSLFAPTGKLFTQHADGTLSLNAVKIVDRASGALILDLGANLGQNVSKAA